MKSVFPLMPAAVLPLVPLVDPAAPLAAALEPFTVPLPDIAPAAPVVEVPGVLALLFDAGVVVLDGVPEPVGAAASEQVDASIANIKRVFLNIASSIGTRVVSREPSTCRVHAAARRAGPRAITTRRIGDVHGALAKLPPRIYDGA
jgi:hypothetical protein